jgi:hypothetical protein
MTYTPQQNGNGYDIIVDGVIIEGDDTEFNRIASVIGTKPSVVTLSGPGGTFNGLEIGRMIRRLGWSTFVKAGAECDSMCANIWLAGQKRWGSEFSLIGFHAASDQNHKEWAAANAVVGGYYKELGLSDDAIALFTTAPPEQLIYLTAETASKYHIEYQGVLPTDVSIQLLYQYALRDKGNAQPPQQPTPPPRNEYYSTLTVTENLKLRQSRTPSAPDVLGGLWPDYIPAGFKFLFDFEDLEQTKRTGVPGYGGRYWCHISNYKGGDGKVYEGWVNAFYLAFDNGKRAGCVAAPTMPECEQNFYWYGR